MKREIGVVPIEINQDASGTKHDAATATSLVQKLGIGNTLPAETKKSFDRLAERDAAWKKATKGKQSGSRDYYVAKYNADLALAQKWGHLTAEQVARTQQWIEHAPVDDIRDAHLAIGDNLSSEFTAARETEKWLEAQDAYATTLGDAMKRGVLTQAQADRARAWARKANHSDIDKSRVMLERKLLGGEGTSHPPNAGVGTSNPPSGSSSGSIYRTRSPYSGSGSIYSRRYPGSMLPPR